MYCIQRCCSFEERVGVFMRLPELYYVAYSSRFTQFHARELGRCFAAVFQESGRSLHSVVFGATALDRGKPNTIERPPRYASRSVCHNSRPVVVENIDHQTTIRKPKNARSKRALEARESKEVEDPHTIIFVRGTHTGEVVKGVIKDLVRIATLNRFHSRNNIVLISCPEHQDGTQATSCNFILQKKCRASIRGCNITRILGT